MFLSSPWLKTVLMAALAMRSSRTRVPFLDRTVRPQSLVGDVPSALFGTSRTMPKTFLSAKKSLPVKVRLLMKPSRSKKKGSLRSPAKNLYSPRVVMWGCEPKEAGAPAITARPPSLSRAARAPFAR